MEFTPILFAILALGAVGLVFGLVLAFAGKKFAVKVDEKELAVRAALGGANCGACGYAGCDAFAAAVVKGEASPSGCPAGGEKTAKTIAAIMGTEADEMEPLVARVRCQGIHDNAADRYDYVGIRSCRAAASYAGGPKLCEFGCIGFGDCVEACKFGAISLSDGIAHIDAAKCTGCGACMKTCPRSIIDLLPRSNTVVVLCRNKAIGRIARLQCKTACVGCKRCEKNCPSGAIHVVDGVAHIDYEKCTCCGACIAGCPMHCIENFYQAEKGIEVE